MNPPLRVLVVDDEALVRDGLGAILATAEGIEVVGEATDGRAAVAAVVYAYETGLVRPGVSGGGW